MTLINKDFPYSVHKMFHRSGSGVAQAALGNEMKVSVAGYVRTVQYNCRSKHHEVCAQVTRCVGVVSYMYSIFKSRTGLQGKPPSERAVVKGGDEHDVPFADQAELQWFVTTQP